MFKVRKIVFLGFAHNTNDPRLYYREIATLKEEGSCYVIWVSDRDNVSMPLIDKPYRLKSFKGKIKKLLERFKSLYRIVKDENPDVIQASDIRELPYIIFLKLFFPRINYIYDSHEDYYNQIRLFENKKLKAWVYKEIEKQSLKLLRKVYCTDEYLLSYYKKHHQHVYLMRNFPNMNLVGEAKKNYEISDDKLKIVYIGTMNVHKGIQDVVDFVERLNEEKTFKKRLELHIYTNLKESEELDKTKSVVYHPYEELSKLYGSLKNYEFGICLWRKHPKFERNLPIKNFDYMSVGLPVLTSNFGNLKHYIEISNAGLCIEPEDYRAFKEAIKTLSNKENREIMGNNGRQFFEVQGFKEEASEYIQGVLLEEKVF